MIISFYANVVHEFIVSNFQKHEFDFFQLNFCFSINYLRVYLKHKFLISLVHFVIQDILDQCWW